MSTSNRPSASFIYHFALGLLLPVLTIQAQSFDYSVTLESVEIENLGGIQSFALGHIDNTWLVVGGRLDGLHRRQPFASFDPIGNNTFLWVIQPQSRSYWKYSLNDLPQPIQEQLSSTNMEFIQKDGWLYCIGGYGYSPSKGDHTTYSNMTAIQIQPVIDAIISGNNPSKYIVQLEDPKFQVTGGQLEVINDTFYLLGGQNFQGRYNPHGPNHGPGFLQEYTESIRPFKVFNFNGNITVEHLEETVDSDVLHRRDYNASPYISSVGDKGIIMFSGVFQKEIDLPFLNAVEVNSAGYRVVSGFEHLLNQYHCPVLPFYSEPDDKMHHLFFGGISQFYFQDEKLIRDDNVPFVNTIGLTTRMSDGTINERALESTMPGYLGAGGEFVPNDNIHFTQEGVLVWSNNMPDTLEVGHIYGGIRSSAANIFFINDGTQSKASSTLFKVHLIRKMVSKVSGFSNENNFQLSISPNPGSDGVLVSFQLEQPDDVEIRIVSLDGAILKRVDLGHVPSGRTSPFISLENIPVGDYIILVKARRGQQGQLISVLR